MEVAAMMHERIREVRDYFDMTRKSFGEKFYVSQDVVNNLERGRVPATEYHIKGICERFNVNEHWLRTGEGDMFNPATQSLDALAEVNQIDDLTRAVITTLIEMPQQQREAFQTLVSNAAEKMRSTDQEGAQAMNIANALDIIEAAKAQGFEMDLDIRTE